MASTEEIFASIRTKLNDSIDSIVETINSLKLGIALPIIAVVLVIIILVIVERLLIRKINIIKGDRNLAYRKLISNIQGGNPKKTLKEIDEIARSYFRERFNLSPPVEYTSLIKIFKQQNNTEIVNFCSLMNDLLYSGKKVNESINEKLIVYLSRILQNNPIQYERKKSFLEKLRDVELKIKEKIFG